MTCPTGEDRYSELVKHYAQMDQTPEVWPPTPAVRALAEQLRAIPNTDTFWSMESTTSVTPEDTSDVLADDPAPVHALMDDYPEIARPLYKAIIRAFDARYDSSHADIPPALKREDEKR